MSISTVREKFFEGGCGKAVLVFIAIAMVVTMGYSTCGKSQSFAATDAKGQRLATFAKIGNVEIPVAWVDKQQEQVVQQQLGGNAQLLESLPPSFAVGMYAQSVSQVIDQGYMLAAALKAGIKIEEEDIKKELSFENFQKQVKDQLISGGQIKESATAAEIDAKIKELAQGKTLAEVHKAQMEEFSKAWADAEKKPLIQAQFGPQMAMEQIKKTINPSDEELKKSFETLEIKRLFARTDEAKVKRAYDEIKAGKSFEVAVDAYSEDTAAQGKKKSDASSPIRTDMVKRTPELASLATLKPGEYTSVTKTQDGYAIYKLQSVKANVPADFDKAKAKYADAFKSEQAQMKFKEQVDQLKKAEPPTFELKGYEAAYIYSKASMAAGDTVPPEVQQAYDIAKGVAKGQPGAELASMIGVAAFQRIYDAKGADKAKLKPERIATIKNFLEYKDNWDMRKEVIDSLKDEKKGDDAFAQVLIAMDKNSKYDATGQRIFSDVTAKFKDLQSAGLVKPDQEKEFRGRQEEWQKAKADYDKTEAELAKQQKEDEARAKASQQPPASAPKK